MIKKKKNTLRLKPKGAPTTHPPIIPLLSPLFAASRIWPANHLPRTETPSIPQVKSVQSGAPSCPALPPLTREQHPPPPFQRFFRVPGATAPHPARTLRRRYLLALYRRGGVGLGQPFFNQPQHTPATYRHRRHYVGQSSTCFKSTRGLPSPLGRHCGHGRQQPTMARYSP